MSEAYIQSTTRARTLRYCICALGIIRRFNSVSIMKTLGPDGVEAWCVALSACFINLVMAGLGRMSGILYVAFIDIYAVDRLQASVPFSARSLTRNLLGPVVGIFGQKYGVRAIAVSGGIIATLSTIACFYAKDMLWITITYGVLNGIGAALTVTLVQVMLSLHFKKYRTTASGMAVSGGCVGSFIFPVLLEYLLWEYGLNGTFLILSGIIMNVIPAAMILNKPSWMNKKPPVKPSITIEDCDNNDSVELVEERIQVEKTSLEVPYRRFCGHSNSFLNFERDGLDRFNSVSEVIFSRSTLVDKLPDKCMIDFKFLRENIGLVTKLINKDFCHNNDAADYKNNLCLLNKISVKAMEDILKDLQRIWTDSSSMSSYGTSSIENLINNDSSSKVHKSMLGRKAKNLKENNEIVIYSIENSIKRIVNDHFACLLHNLMKEDYCTISQSFSKHGNILPKLLEQFLLIHTLLEEMKSRDLSQNVVRSNSRNTPVNLTETGTEQSNTFATHIKTAFRLHTNPMFLLISLCRSVHFLTFVPAVTILVDFAMDKGLLEEDGKYVITALSLGDLLGRLCLGWVTDKEFIGLPRYMFIIMVLQGASTVSVSFMYSRATLLTAIAIFAFLQGSLFVRHPVLVSKYLDKNEQSVAMGCFNFFAGLLGFTFPNYIGYFRDTIGSYDYIFYINGSVGAFVGCLWIFEPYFRKHSKRELNDND